MEDINQDETAQTTVADGEVITEAVDTNNSELVEKENVPAEAETVIEESVEASNNELAVEAVIEEPVNTSGSEPVIAEAVRVEENVPLTTGAVNPEIIAEQKPTVELKSVVEALLFVTSDPLELDKIQEIIGTGYNGQKLEKKQVRDALAELTADYQNKSSALQLVEIANGWQLCTKKEYAVWLDKLAKTKDVYKLSNSALETLSIIAYKQPLTRAEVEHIRGVDSGGVIHNLLEKRLVRITGRKEVLGHPLLYGTSDEFLQYFGLASIADLPMLEDLNKS
ncbi:MAG: SMC-Scp complex subunit ScpB [bacterium]|nr:SMC-Scp complex subunit ScpB [bacterium]